MRKKLRLYTVIIVLCAVFATLNACASAVNKNNNELTTLEYGFEIPYGDCSISSGSFAYKADKTLFDIDDVVVTVFFGSIFHDDIDFELQHVSYPEFDIYFSAGKPREGKNDILYLIRHVEENYVSEKYRVRHTEYSDNNKLAVYFSHSEDVKIPKELFGKETGCLEFKVGGINVNSENNEFRAIEGAWADIYYKVEGTNVRLSSKSFSI